MYQRRRPPPREIAFSFDSFLDVVANVVGIILRLILVAWVGARSYKAVLPPPAPEPPALVEPALLPDPTDPRLAEFTGRRREIARTAEEAAEREREKDAAARNKLSLESALTELVSRQQELEGEKRRMENDTADKAGKARLLALSTGELKDRCGKLLAEIEQVRNAPTARQALRYRTPVSRPLVSDELMFECRQGRVTLIDIAALKDLAMSRASGMTEKLRSSWEVEDSTSPVGAFRLRFTVERKRTTLDVLARTPTEGGFSYYMSGWEVVPVREDRGETVEQALQPTSAFRKVVDALDPDQTAVTLWVYNDSFPLYRLLRDYLHEKEMVVAGRPLHVGTPIGAQKGGTLSRGQ